MFSLFVVQSVLCKKNSFCDLARFIKLPFAKYIVPRDVEEHVNRCTTEVICWKFCSLIENKLQFFDILYVPHGIHHTCTSR